MLVCKILPKKEIITRLILILTGLFVCSLLVFGSKSEKKLSCLDNSVLTVIGDR